MDHDPQIGDIWKNKYFRDKIWEPLNFLEGNYLIYEVLKNKKCIAYSFERCQVTEISVKDWSNSIGESCWEKIA